MTKWTVTPEGDGLAMECDGCVYKMESVTPTGHKLVIKDGDTVRESQPIPSDIFDKKIRYPRLDLNWEYDGKHLYANFKLIGLPVLVCYLILSRNNMTQYTVVGLLGNPNDLGEFSIFRADRPTLNEAMDVAGQHAWEVHNAVAKFKHPSLKEG